MSAPGVVKQLVSLLLIVLNAAIFFKPMHLQRYKKRQQNEMIYPKNCPKPVVSNTNCPTKRKNLETKPGRRTKGINQRKRSIRKDILNDSKRVYGNPAALNSRSKTQKKENIIKQEPVKTCSLESIIYVGTVYKFKGYTLTNTVPPTIDLTMSTSDLNLEHKSVGSFSLNTIKSTALNSLSSHTMYPSTEKITVANSKPSKLPVTRVHNSYSADAINTKRIPKQMSPYVKLSNRDSTLMPYDDSELLDIVIKMEEEYKTDEALRCVDLKETMENSDHLGDLNDIDKFSLVSDLNLSLCKLTQLYDVNTEVKN